MKSILKSWLRKRGENLIGAKIQSLISDFPKTGQRKMDILSIPTRPCNKPENTTVYLITYKIDTNQPQPEGLASGPGQFGSPQAVRRIVSSSVYASLARILHEGGDLGTWGVGLV